ncbi:MAG TPA: hypothetical protein VHE35_23605, partial [Kofleriaceae bacterium]|nr:hypothetical protein [Kofleriaceae bacterium]
GHGAGGYILAASMDEPDADPAAAAPAAADSNVAEADEGDAADDASRAATADLAAVVEQARTLHGAPRTPIAAGGNRLLRGIDLRVPGWPLGAWDSSAGEPGAPFEPDDAPPSADATREDLRLAWLADTGHLLWLATDRASDNLRVIVADTPRSFRGCICERPDVGDAVWQEIVLQVPLLAACPLGFDAWRTDRPRTSHPGGPSLFADPLDRALDEELAALVRRVHDPDHGRAEQTWFTWASGGVVYRVGGVFAATATERHFDPGQGIPPDAIRHFLLVSTLGTWFTYTTLADETATVREYDTIRDLYRFQIAGRPPHDVFRRMWENLAARLPLARDAELNPLSRWAPRP